MACNRPKGKRFKSLTNIGFVAVESSLGGVFCYIIILNVVRLILISIRYHSFSLTVPLHPS